MGILDLYNPKKIKENWGKVRGNPYASLKFQYWVTFALIVGIILFISYTIINIIVKYDGGSSIMTMMIRGVFLIVMVVIVLQAWGTLAPLKNALKHYEQNPASQKSVAKSIDVAKEVNEILDNIERNKKGRQLAK